MPKIYKIELTVPVTVRVLVSAHDKQEAREKVENSFSGLMVEWNGNSAFTEDDNTQIVWAADDFDTCEVTEISEATPAEVEEYEPTFEDNEEEEGEEHEE